MHPYERWILRRYLANSLKSNRFAKSPHPDKDIVTWIEGYTRLLGLPFLAAKLRSSRRAASSIEVPINQASWKAWRAAAIGLARVPAPSPSPLQKRLNWLAAACDLTEAQAQILGILARTTQTHHFNALVEAVNDRFGLDFGATEGADFYPFLDTNAERVELSAGGRLSELGLIDVREAPRLSVVVRRLLALPRFGPRRVSDLLLGEPARPSLGWSDFEHLGDLRELTAKIVRAADTRIGPTRRGVNLLFYGPPGSGKTEFAKTLGAHLRFSVQFCGETNEDNSELNRHERIAALMIANAIGGVARKTIVVVDEADDLFVGFNEDDNFGRRGSKVFMNRLLERTVAPTIWVTNDIHRLGPAIIRRMNLALCFSKPALAVRKTIVARIASGVGFRLGEDAVRMLANTPASPAINENAIRSATQIRGSSTDGQRILDSSLLALGRREAPRSLAPIPFDPALSSADVNLPQLADQIAKSRGRALSFCLSGPPGTGKSAYARHLAERLDLDVLERRYSDLSSMWLGESEKAIAAAFEEAADVRAFLILDEADSLLRDRRAALHSWEITQVNEMLTWMERHPYPFVCTTNAPELLDAAAARRFLFKVRFLQMRPQQIAEAFRRAFGAEAPAFILGLDGLTPGDFATVARKANALDEHNPETLSQWLEREAQSKPDAGRQKIGF